MLRWFTGDVSGLLLLGLHAKATLILLAAVGVAGLAARRAPAIRHVVWTVGVLGVLLLPLGWWLLPSVPVGGRRIPVVAAAFERIDAWGSAGAIATEVEVTAQPASGVAAVDGAGERRGLHGSTRAATEHGTVSWLGVLAAVWGAGVVLRLGWLGVQLWQARRLVRKGREESAEDRIALVSMLARRLGVPRPVRVLYSDRVDVPCMCGVVRPIVLLPPGAARWPGEMLASVLLHELAHVRRHDSLTGLVAEAAAAMYWPNPLVWAARRGLHAAQERASDEMVLRAGIPTADYARHLLDVARSCGAGHTRLAAALFFGGEARLEARVRAILDRPGPVTAGGARGAACIAAAVLMTILTIVAHPAVASTAAAEDSSGAVSLIQDDERLLRDGDYSPSGPATTGQAVEAGVEGRYRGLTGAPTATASTAAVGADPVVGTAGSARAVPRTYFWIPAPAADESDSTAISIDVERSGQYIIWGRVVPDRSDDDNVQVTIDGVAAGRWDLPDRRTRRRQMDADWYAVSSRATRGRERSIVVELDAGSHMLIATGRGAGERLEGLLVTDDADYEPRGAPPETPPAYPVSIWLEAEDATTSDAFEVDHDSDAAAHRFLRVVSRHSSRDDPPRNGSAELHFDIAVAGSYIVWARTRVRDNDEDSFWVRIDDGAWIEWNDIERDRDWRWSRVHNHNDSNRRAAFHLAAGAHTIVFAYRETGTRLDRVLLTNDFTVRPRGRGADAPAFDDQQRSAAGRPSPAPGD